MSRFRNDNSHAIGFDLGGRRYDIESGAEESIPSRFAFGVKAMGLPLTPVDSDEDEVAQAVSDERPTEASALLWYGRAVEQRKQVYALQGELSTAKARIVAGDEEIDLQSSTLLDVGSALSKEQAHTAELLASLETARAELATIQTERTALLAKVATLEEAATAPATKPTKGKATPAGDPPATPSTP